jgi:hypothetical protein
MACSVARGSESVIPTALQFLAKYSDYKLYIAKAEGGRVFYRAG